MKIGLDNPLTGTYAAVGKNELNGCELAVDKAPERFDIDLTVPLPLGQDGDTPVHVQGYVTRLR